MIKTDRKPKWRSIRTSEIYRLSHCRKIIGAKAILCPIAIEGVKIIRSSQSRYPLNKVGRFTQPFQPLPVKSQHHHIISTRGMSRQKYPVRITAQRCNIIMNPRDGFRTILQKGGEFHVWIKPVIDKNCHISAMGKGTACKSIFILGPRVPAAAMNEYNYRKRFAFRIFG